MRNPFRYFNSSPEVIRLAVMMYIRYPLPYPWGLPETAVVFDPRGIPDLVLPPSPKVSVRATPIDMTHIREYSSYERPHDVNDHTMDENDRHLGPLHLPCLRR